MGNKPASQRELSPEERVEALKKQLSDAINEQNFELAAQLRDEIIAIVQMGGDE